jgi:hypothetical protein
MLFFVFQTDRNANNVDLNIYRKPKYIDITIHLSSNHPYGHKLATFFLFSFIGYNPCFTN